MGDLERIRDSLLEDNVRYLPYYAVDELIENIISVISEEISQGEKELLEEIKCILRHSPRCTILIHELLA